MTLAPSRVFESQHQQAAEGDRPAGLEPLEARELLSASPQILAAGDSITFGTPNPDQSYRRELDRALGAAGVDAEFVGTRSDGRGFDGDHFSQPGIRAEVTYRGSRGDLRTSLNDSFRRGEVLNDNERPDLILLHIGTNSLNQNSNSVGRAADELETLLNTLADRWRRGEFASDVTVLLADIVPGGRREGGGGGFVLDTNRLENTRSYNAQIGSVIARLNDRGFANQIQRVDLARIDASTLDRSAFSASEWRAINNDGDRWVDWFNGVDENGSQRGATGNNGALFSNDLLHPTSLGYRVLGQAWFNAIEATGKLDAAPPPRSPAPAPRQAPTSTSTPSIAGAGAIGVGQSYQLRLDAGGANVQRWRVDFGDGTPGRFFEGVSTVNHTFRSTGDRVIRAFAEIDGRRVGVDPVRLTVTGQAQNPAPAPAPTASPAAAPTPSQAPATSGEPSISGAGAVGVGQSYQLRLDAGGANVQRWRVDFGDGTPGRFFEGVSTINHTFRSTGDRVIRVFAEVDGRRVGLAPVRLTVTSQAQPAAPAPARAPVAAPAAAPVAAPTPAQAPTASGEPSISGAGAVGVGQSYQLRLDAGGANVQRWRVDFGDGTPGRFFEGVSTINHTFRSTGDRVIRVFAEVDGRRVGVAPVRLTVTSQAQPAAPAPAPASAPAPAPASPSTAQASGEVSISGQGDARVGSPYEVRFSNGGLRGVNWYISFGDGTRGRFVGDIDRIQHTFTSTSGERVIRAFAEVNGERIGAEPIRLRVR